MSDRRDALQARHGALALTAALLAKTEEPRLLEDAAP
jgi:hypothetical protein